MAGSSCHVLNGKGPRSQSVDPVRTLEKMAMEEWRTRDRSFMGPEGGMCYEAG